MWRGVFRVHFATLTSTVFGVPQLRLGEGEEEATEQYSLTKYFKLCGARAPKQLRLLLQQQQQGQVLEQQRQELQEGPQAGLVDEAAVDAAQIYEDGVDASGPAAPGGPVPLPGSVPGLGGSMGGDAHMESSYAEDENGSGGDEDGEAWLSWSDRDEGDEGDEDEDEDEDEEEESQGVAGSKRLWDDGAAWGPGSSWGEAAGVSGISGSNWGGAVWSPSEQARGKRPRLGHAQARGQQASDPAPLPLQPPMLLPALQREYDESVLLSLPPPTSAAFGSLPDHITVLWQSVGPPVVVLPQPSAPATATTTAATATAVTIAATASGGQDGLQGTLGPDPARSISGLQRTLGQDPARSTGRQPDLAATAATAASSRLACGPRARGQQQVAMHGQQEEEEVGGMQEATREANGGEDLGEAGEAISGGHDGLRGSSSSRELGTSLCGLLHQQHLDVSQGEPLTGSH